MENKINYLFSSVDKENGFTEKQALCLKNDIKGINILLINWLKYVSSDVSLNLLYISSKFLFINW